MVRRTLSLMNELTAERNLLIIDPLAESTGHLLEDDMFWGQALAPHVDHFSMVSSKASVEQIRRSFPGLGVSAHSDLGDAIYKRTRSLHLKYLSRMTIFADRGHTVLLQSFHELSAMWFSMLNPRLPIYLIVTNNLTGAGTETARRRAAQNLLFQRAKGIFVGSNHEKMTIARLFPKVPLTRVHKVRYHKVGKQREILPLADRAREIAFLGASTGERGIDTFIRWATLDSKSRYTFHIYGDIRPTGKQQASFAALYPKIQVVGRYLTDEEYHGVIAKSMFIALPFERSLEGRLSGVLCDAISHGTPVLAANQDPHTDFFKTYGEFGFLIDNGSDEVIRGCLDSCAEDRWDSFQAAMHRARTDHTVGAIAEDILRVLFG